MTFMRTFLLFSILAMAALSGCFGTDPEEVTFGKVVVVSTVLVDGNGTPLGPAQEQDPFVVGSGQSPFGEAFERELVGHSTNETVSYDLDVFTMDAQLPDQPSTFRVTVPQVAQVSGIDAANLTIGTTIPGFGLYGEGLEIVAIEDAQAELAYMIRDDEGGRQVETFERLGLQLELWIENGTLHQRLRPIEGSVIEVPVVDAEGEPFDPFGAGPGVYRVGRAVDDRIEIHPAQPTTVQATIVEVRAAPEDTDGHFGTRVSPVQR